MYFVNDQIKQTSVNEFNSPNYYGLVRKTGINANERARFYNYPVVFVDRSIGEGASASELIMISKLTT